MTSLGHQLEADGSPMRVYVDGPEDAPAGVIVMVHGPGLDAFIERQVNKLAAHGYAAAAMNVFHRQPDDGSTAMQRVARLRDDEIIADVEATVAHLRQRGVSELAITGFCMGGRSTYLLAGARPEVWKAAGVFYGGNIMVAWGGETSPFDRTANIACPVIGFFGEDDTNPSPADVDRIEAELVRHGKVYEFHRYAGAGHAFLNFTNPERHRPTQAADAWDKLLAFLDRHLPGKK